MGSRVVGDVSRYARGVATLHFIYGWPGAGKTTLARELGERERAVVFCEDEWLATLAPERITSLQHYVEVSARTRRLDIGLTPATANAIICRSR